MKASEYLQAGIDDLIFTRDSHTEGGFIYIKLTDLFIKSWNRIIEGKNIQKEFDTFIMKALVEHYTIALKVKKKDWDTDKMTSLGCIIRDLKSKLFKPQTDITIFGK